MKRNQLTLELIHTQIREDELCHMTPEEKKAYNAQYYQRNKEKYWGVTGNRPVGRQKYVTEGNGQGVQRRGFGGLTSSRSGRPSKFGTTPRREGKRSGSFDYYDDEIYKYGYQSSLPANHPRRKAQDDYEKAKSAAKEAFNEAERHHTKQQDYIREARKLSEANKNEKDKEFKRINNRNIERYMELAKQEDAERTRCHNQYLSEVEGMKKALNTYRMSEAQAKMEYETHDNVRPGSAVSAQVNSDAFSSAYKKAERKQKVKKAASQASSDWKSGSKTVKQLASDSVAKGKSIASSIFSKFKK